MNDSMLFEHGLIVRGNARSFEATALVDADVDNDAAVFHIAHHIVGYDNGCPSTAGVNGTYGHIGSIERVAEFGGLDGAGPEAVSNIVLEATQFVGAVVEHLDRCTQA